MGSGGAHGTHVGGHRCQQSGTPPNLHPHPTPIDLVAEQPLPGSADLCFVTGQDIGAVIAHLDACGVPIEWGPGARTGAEGPITSVYCRDPDNNLIEIASDRRD